MPLIPSGGVTTHAALTDVSTPHVPTDISQTSAFNYSSIGGTFAGIITGAKIGTTTSTLYGDGSQMTGIAGAVAIRTVTKVVAASNSASTAADYVCDGIADEVQIQAAIDASTAIGGIVYLMEGTYNIGQTINIKANKISLVGAGKGTNIASTANVTMISGSATTSGLLISNLLLTGTAGLNRIIQFDAVTNSVIERCWADNCRTFVFLNTDSHENLITKNTVDCGGIGNSDAIWVYDSERCIISNNKVFRSFDDGIVLESNAKGCTVEGNIVKYIRYEAISIKNTNCINNIIANNFVEGTITSEVGIQVYGAYCTISGNSASSVLYGIILNTAYDNTVTGNSCYLNRNDGIRLTNSSRNTVANNSCLNNSQSGAGNYDGIYLINSSSYNVIIGNQCNDNQGVKTQNYGIAEASTLDNYNLIIGNSCQGNNTDAILQMGANSSTVHNI